MEWSCINQDSNEIQFDILKIDSCIQKEKFYKDGENLFLLYSENNSFQEQKFDYPKYFAKVKFSNFEYIGILSKFLKKENYGYIHFENGDEYFGQWNKDKKEGYGIYFFKGEEKGVINQVYIGEFKKNFKSGEGIYFIISNFDDKNKVDNFAPPSAFNLLVGIFSEDQFVKGLLFTYDEGKRKIYKGIINKEGDRDDDNAEIYEDNDKIFFGKVKKNNLIEGRTIIMKDGEKDTGYYFIRRGNNNSDDNFDYDYEKGAENDNKYINKLNEMNFTFDVGKIQEIFVNIMKIKEKLNSSDNFEYIKNLNYDVEVKQELRNQYGKYLFC